MNAAPRTRSTTSTPSAWSDILNAKAFPDSDTFANIVDALIKLKVATFVVIKRIDFLSLEESIAWQRLHAEQRLRAVDFFLVADAFLIAGYVTSVGTNAALAAVAAVAGVVVSFGFQPKWAGVTR